MVFSAIYIQKKNKNNKYLRFATDSFTPTFFCIIENEMSASFYNIHSSHLSCSISKQETENLKFFI